MPARVAPGPIQDNMDIREAVCIHTRKIYDSCRDKDCLSDLRVYPTVESQAVLANALSVRAKSAQLLFVTIDVEEVTFNRGFYSVDIRFYYKILGEASTAINRAVEITGLSVFDKRVILFASEGNAKVFSSDTILGGVDQLTIGLTNKPKAIVEAVDPIILEMKLMDVCNVCSDQEVFDVPPFIINNFPGGISFDATERRWYVSLGQFSIVRMERDSQLLIPSYDYCMPNKECTGNSCKTDDPCSLFEKITFPTEEFFPPDTICQPSGYREAVASLSK